MKTQCPNCKARFSTSETSVGKQAKCPKCAKPFIIQPFIEAPAAAEPPAASPKPTEPKVQKTEPPAPASKITAPKAPPTKSPEPVAPRPKIAKTVSPPQEAPEPVESKESGIAELLNIPVRIKEILKQEKGLSKTVFVYYWAAARVIAGVLGGLGLILIVRNQAYSILFVTFAVADVFLLCSLLIELMLFYKMWSAIADEETSVSPDKAVAFLLIPVFNIYWALCMLTGFVEDYNAIIHRRSIKAEDLSFMLFLIYAFAFILSALVVVVPMVCVFAFVGLISRVFDGYPAVSWALFFFAFVAGVAHFITYILVTIKTCDAINALQ